MKVINFKRKNEVINERTALIIRERKNLLYLYREN